MPSTIDNPFSLGATLPTSTTLGDITADDLLDWGRSDPASDAFWSEVTIPTTAALATAVNGDTLFALAEPVTAGETVSGASSGAPATQANMPAGKLTGTATDWKGDEAIGAGVLTESIPSANATMYAKLGTELDAVLGKGQYVKPKNHYEYVKLVAQAMKQLSPEQQVTFKNRLEQIGQPLHINFGLTRTRHEGSIAYGIPLNSYAQNPFSSAQQTQEVRLKQEFFDERDLATGRSK